MHAASAAVGVAIANLLPQITLTASEGGTSTVLGDLLASGNTFWTAGAGLTQTLFAGGALVHRKRAADAALDAAGAQYRAVVLAAFQNVADSLTALRSDADAVNASYTAERAAASSLEVVRHNLQLGSVSYIWPCSIRAGLPAGWPGARPGPGQPLRRYRGAVPGPRRGVVEPQNRDRLHARQAPAVTNLPAPAALCINFTIHYGPVPAPSVPLGP